ncbi:ABC transporter ATP-binding protein [Peribacillus sp. FSL H8-0477]|uniref:ABC transporter ATP-binding protein n=1 Tax=Peribacillus sp. FSL H8-0477 TaxID=2921388 RepID=UPI0030F898B9
MTSLLEVKNLQKAFGRSKEVQVDVLKDVSFSLKQGEIIGLIGASGAGKSTIGQIIAGLETADAGEIIFENQDLLSLKAKERRSFAKYIQMVFQDPYEALSSRMKIGQLVAEPLVIQGLEKGKRLEKVRHALTSVTLDPDKYMDRYPHELSGGERQRVGLARAFVCAPKLIIADEPTSMLDSSLRLELVELMKKMNECNQVAYVFITHDIALTRGFCDRLIVLQKGEIVEAGKTNDLIENPQHPYTQSLINALLILENHKGAY